MSSSPHSNHRKIHGRTLILAALSILSVVPGLRAGDDDPEVWTMQSITQRFDYGLAAVLETEQRFGTGHGQVFQRNEVTPQLVWHYSPRYDFGIGYERMDEWDRDGQHTSADEGLFYATILLPLKDWKLSSRQRFQFGVEEGESTGVFRHRVQVAYEGDRLPFRLMPFIANEWYFDLLDGKFTENRFWGGLRYRFHRTAEIEVFGMRVDDFTHTPTHTVPVVGVGLNLGF
jgi:hypothetical protein